ncbi:ATP-binding protein [Flavobacterium aquicola]|uniref:Histidine kinase/DNA gyrase B/HSP90-like ATPase n=1 Tax=Flavobacterium aquicola TaxID=1682742 RepID=A0A3E0E3U0_9FLAO|nr:ATP-binding protein [Flavobacterium aquicola]REG92957.1 histidine kinase/DNA gyrase B/HSP90-like ATPase [Flavobacterium aquicola]
MDLKSQKNFFQPRARLLLQLGDKLIKNENIALLELIKNSYDADSRWAKVKLRNVEDKNNGYIEILDEGEGMDIKIIEDVWLEPGSDYKEDLFRKRVRTPKYLRLPIGEKGIGRFGVHKLGSKIELISKRKDKNEVVVRIDWNEFAKNKYLKDAKFDVFERTNPEYFKGNKTGTKIIISNLRSAWDKKMVRDLYKSVFTLNSPFHKTGKFSVEIDIDNTKLLDKMPVWDDVQKFSLWHFKCKIEGYEIKEFLYEFTPWNSLIGIKGREITEKDDYIKDRSTLVYEEKINGKKKETILNLSKNYGDRENPKSIGSITFEGYIFDRDKLTLDLSNQQGIALLKEYLDEQGGIRVYRNNIRINEYGEKGNDWLSLDLRRVNIPAKRVSNNIILSVIDLDEENSSALIEKTNREGFIENEAFNDFCTSILYTLNIIETLRKDDKDTIRRKFNPTEKQEPVINSLGKLKDLVDSKIENESLKIEITKHLVKIEEDYNHINEVLLTSAGVGLTMGVGIHEVQKVIAELNYLVTEESVPANILNLVKHLDELIENYSDLFRQAKNQEEDAIKLINGAVFNVEYRLKAHNIQLIKDYQNRASSKIDCSKRLMLGAIVNIIDNSIYWLERKTKKNDVSNSKFEKKILIELYNNESYVDILIADNGFGFGLPIHQLTKPFVSDKTSGMGLGLHIVSEVMKVQKGQILFPEIGEYDLDEEFENGAVVVLRLNKKKL